MFLKRFTLLCLLPFTLIYSAHAESIGLVTGPKTGTYIAIGRDVATIAQEVGIAIEVKESGGSIDNIKRINSNENAGLGIVQSDVLGFLKRSKNPDTMKIANSLRMMLPLFREEVHVLARNDIKQFSDLKGKSVVVGEEGSGNMLTAVNLLTMMEVKVKDTLRMPPPEGVVAVLNGEADAIIFVGGKPLRLFKNVEELRAPQNKPFHELLSTVHFIPMNHPRMLEEYSTSEITPEDYGFVTEKVPTIAVTAVLVTYDYSTGKSKDQIHRCKTIRTLTDALRTNLPQLQQTGHPKWREVVAEADVGIWKKDACSWGNAAMKTDAKGELLHIVGKN